jgi:hypothetical protein
VDLSPLDEALRQRLIAAEEAIYAAADDPMVNWDENTLVGLFADAGFDAAAEVTESESQVRITNALLNRCLRPRAKPAPPTASAWPNTSAPMSWPRWRPSSAASYGGKSSPGKPNGYCFTLNDNVLFAERGWGLDVFVSCHGRHLL